MILWCYGVLMMRKDIGSILGEEHMGGQAILRCQSGVFALGSPRAVGPRLVPLWSRLTPAIPEALKLPASWYRDTLSERKRNSGPTTPRNGASRHSTSLPAHTLAGFFPRPGPSPVRPITARPHQGGTPPLTRNPRTKRTHKQMTPGGPPTWAACDLLNRESVTADEPHRLAPA